MAATTKKNGATLNRHRGNQAHPTPWEFVSAMESRFGPLEIDLAARKKDAKAGRFISRRENSLKQDWTMLLRGGIGYLNPPFDPITPWINKCVEEAVKGARLLVLSRASIDANWFWTMYSHCEVYALAPRLKFVGSNDVYPGSLILSAFNFGVWSGRIERWYWRRDALSDNDGRC